MNTDSLEVLNQKHKQDFNTALNIYENDYSHEDLIKLLENGSIVEKQISALKLDTINSTIEADIFMSNLTGCDGKIREAVSFRLQEFTANILCTNFHRSSSRAVAATVIFFQQYLFIKYNLHFALSI